MDTPLESTSLTWRLVFRYFQSLNQPYALNLKQRQKKALKRLGKEAIFG